MDKSKTNNEEQLNSRLIPEINIGLFGHVDHGKTTLVQALTGKWADTHSEEMKRGITIRLGYADATFYKCKNCNEPSCYSSSPECPTCSGKCEPLRTVSFVDAPGHETLMAMVLSAASVIDGALLLIAANEECPQPQTSEHLVALDMTGVKNIVIVQNKIDLINEEEAIKNYEQIKKFTKGTIAEDAPIIPVSAHDRVNIDALIEAIQKNIPTPKRDPKKTPKMLVARSFDVNKPGTSIEKLKGGVIGGSLIQGEFKLGDEIEIRPVYLTKNNSITTKIVGLQKKGKNLKKAYPGGLLGVQTTLDPFFTKADSLSGTLAGQVGKLPPIFERLKMKISLMDKIVGTKENLNVGQIRTGETLMLTNGTEKTIGLVTSGRKDIIEVKLNLLICAEKESKIAISRQVRGRWRLIGYGEII